MREKLAAIRDWLAWLLTHNGWFLLAVLVLGIGLAGVVLFADGKYWGKQEATDRFEHKRLD